MTYDRRNHPHIAVLGIDIFTSLRKELSEEQFKDLDNTLEKMIETDFNKGDTAIFPQQMTDWYFNRHNHYYHEPNDQEFMEYIRSTYKKGVAV